jgi:hypothetical protein
LSGATDDVLPLMRVPFKWVGEQQTLFLDAPAQEKIFDLYGGMMQVVVSKGCIPIMVAALS